MWNSFTRLEVEAEGVVGEGEEEEETRPMEQGSMPRWMRPAVCIALSADRTCVMYSYTPYRQSRFKVYNTYVDSP